MDAFYLCVPLVRKRRVHFHHFMREIHRELDELKGTEDPIAAVAERTARRYRLICFDEFHVSDIADAMILGRFLEQMMERGVEFVHDLATTTRTSSIPTACSASASCRRSSSSSRGWTWSSVDSGIDYRRLKMEKAAGLPRRRRRAEQLEKIFAGAEGRGGGDAAARRRGPHDPVPQARRRPGVVRLRGAVRRAALVRRLRRPRASASTPSSFPACRACRRRTPTPRGASPGWSTCSTTSTSSWCVSAEAAPEELFTEGENARRLPAHREPAARDAVGRVLRLLPVRRVAGAAAARRLEQAQHRRPFEHAVGPARARLIEVRGFFQNLLATA